MAIAVDPNDGRVLGLYGALEAGEADAHRALRAYPPGSTFKAVTALAGLSRDLVNATEERACQGSHEHGQRRFHCGKRSGHGDMNLTRALASSCSVYFYDLSVALGLDPIIEQARAMGLGAPPTSGPRSTKGPSTMCSVSILESLMSL